MSDNAPELTPANVPTPEPPSGGGTLPFREGELNDVLNGFRNKGADTYARALRLAVDDGYRLPGEHEKAFAALRPDAGHAPAQATADAGMTEAEAFDHSGFVPASSAADYNIRWFEFAPGAPDLGKLDASMRTALHQMELPASIGGTIAEYGWRDAQKFGQLDETGRELHAIQQRAELAKFFPDLPAAMKTVDAMVERIADKELAKTLADEGFFSTRVIVLLHAQAQRMAARRAMK